MDRRAQTSDGGELSWQVVGGDAWESARPRPSDVRPQAERWEPIVDNLARGRLVAVAYDGTMAGRKGLAVSLAHAAARRGFRVACRHTADVVIFRRDDSRSVTQEQGARLAERQSLEHACVEGAQAAALEAAQA